MFIEGMLAPRYPPYVPGQAKKMESLTGDLKPPFTHAEGSANNGGGFMKSVSSAGVGIFGGIVGLFMHESRKD
jgi:hypothetical protein